MPRPGHGEPLTVTTPRNARSWTTVMLKCLVKFSWTAHTSKSAPTSFWLSEMPVSVKKKCTDELDIRSSERKVSLEVFLQQNIMEAHHGYIKNASPDFLTATPCFPRLAAALEHGEETRDGGAPDARQVSWQHGSWLLPRQGWWTSDDSSWRWFNPIYETTLPWVD